MVTFPGGSEPSPRGAVARAFSVACIVNAEGQKICQVKFENECWSESQRSSGPIDAKPSLETLLNTVEQPSRFDDTTLF